ncbi:hypothetical protein QBC38DRAFT_157206 [Podospora fimiseda]|uniref:Uncharacterized protein n=1 Tax=Podospora fimiseda TaxID=252190 RepID=A0AAN7BRZ4_9PEZI|nr:hypothetical protein QBC38DRAFT_157206 [Podospora fimiseda]
MGREFFEIFFFFPSFLLPYFWGCIKWSFFFGWDGKKARGSSVQFIFFISLPCFCLSLFLFLSLSYNTCTKENIKKYGVRFRERKERIRKKFAICFWRMARWFMGNLGSHSFMGNLGSHSFMGFFGVYGWMRGEGGGGMECKMFEGRGGEWNDISPENLKKLTRNR